MLLDRTGAVRTRYELPPAPWTVISVAPEGKRALAATGRDLWIVDLSRSVPMRFASTSFYTSAAWSPVGDRVAYVTSRAGRNEIRIAALDGRGEIVPTIDERFKTVNDWSHDGRYLVFSTHSGTTRRDLWLLPLEGDRKPVPYLQAPWSEYGAQVSPDGRWLAYVSNETGRDEVYVQSFPRPGRKVRVSLDGGGPPEWARGGRELLYPTATTLLSVPVEAGEEFRPGQQRRLDCAESSRKPAAQFAVRHLNRLGAQSIVGRLAWGDPTDAAESARVAEAELEGARGNGVTG